MDEVRRVTYRGRPHRVVATVIELFLLKGKEWSTSIRVTAPDDGPWHHLRCEHPDPCPDIEYVKRVRARKLRPGKSGKNEEDWVHFDRHDPMHGWFHEGLLTGHPKEEG